MRKVSRDFSQHIDTLRALVRFSDVGEWSSAGEYSTNEGLIIDSYQIDIPSAPVGYRLTSVYRSPASISFGSHDTASHGGLVNVRLTIQSLDCPGRAGQLLLETGEASDIRSLFDQACARLGSFLEAPLNAFMANLGSENSFRWRRNIFTGKVWCDYKDMRAIFRRGKHKIWLVQDGESDVIEVRYARVSPSDSHAYFKSNAFVQQYGSEVQKLINKWKLKSRMPMI